MEANIYSRSFGLVKISVGYIVRYPQLLLAHLISFVGTFVSIWLLDPRQLLGAGPVIAQILKSLCGLVVAGSFAIWLGNIALIVFIHSVLDGGKPSLAEGIYIALLRIPKLICWTVVTYVFTVPVAFIAGIVNRFSSASNLFFGIGSSFMSSWSFSTHFVVPLLAIENAGLINAIQKSSNLAEQSWVQEVLENVSLGFMFILLAAPNLLLSGIPSAWRYLPAFFLLLTLMAYGAASSIYQTALYYFAKSGEVPPGFEPVFAPETLQSQKEV